MCNLVVNPIPGLRVSCIVEVASDKFCGQENEATQFEENRTCRIPSFEVLRFGGCVKLKYQERRVTANEPIAIGASDGVQ